MLAMASRDTRDRHPSRPPTRLPSEGESDPEAIWATMAECSGAWGWPGWRVKRLLRRCKAAKRLGGRWYTSLNLLRRPFPEDADRMWAKVQRFRASKRTRTD